MAAKKLLVGHQFENNIKVPFEDRMVGIELEVENAPGVYLQDPEDVKRCPLEGAKQWAAIRDNSLRDNGAEFVSFPLPISEVPEACEALFSLQKVWGQTWKGSVRTGLHVHVNVRDFAAQQLQNFFVTYALMEPALFDYVGQEREECIYCVPWYRANGDAKVAARILGGSYDGSFPSQLKRMTRNLAKYSALFLQPITRIGTVEFRMAPTWLKAPRVSEWAQICERIVSYSADVVSHETVLDRFDANPEKFVAHVTDGVMQSEKGYEKLVLRTGSDLLARSLFPKPMEEWARLYDQYIPMSAKPAPATFNPYSGHQLYTHKKAYKNKVGETMINPDGIKVIWDGAAWVDDLSSLPDGYVKYFGMNKWKKWNANLQKWSTTPPPTVSPNQMQNIPKWTLETSMQEAATVMNAMPAPELMPSMDPEPDDFDFDPEEP